MRQRLGTAALVHLPLSRDVASLKGPGSPASRTIHMGLRPAPPHGAVYLVRAGLPKAVAAGQGDQQGGDALLSGPVGESRKMSNNSPPPSALPGRALAENCSNDERSNPNSGGPRRPVSPALGLSTSQEGPSFSKAL